MYNMYQVDSLQHKGIYRTPGQSFQHSPGANQINFYMYSANSLFETVILFKWMTVSVVT